MFGKLFGGRAGVEPPNSLAMVRNVTVGRTVSLDPLAWQRLGEETRFTLDRDALEITGQGVIALDDGKYIHRFYTDDHIMLQAMSDEADGAASYDFSLFTPWSSAYPPNDRYRRIWRDRLSEPSFDGEAEDLPIYPRFWFPDSDIRQPPVTLWESVFDDRFATKPYAKIYQTCMLYARDLSGGREMLLALEMEPEGGEVTHELMVGIPLEVGEFRA
ncbi:MAG: DUF2491 family protein [Oxalobacteraceae bacterium]|nr:MAG: DUF2491 family protein [Oxalobacteraceae bacterium]